MEVSGNEQRRRGYRRRRSLRGGRRAVVSVVGTLLALLVFFALFGIFVTQYVPVWMGDNEAAFSSGLQASLADLKSHIDFQTITGGPASLGTPFTLASQGIPLFAAPTTATMNFVPKTPGVFVNVTMQFGPGGRAGFYQNASLGTLLVNDPNRYYPAQSFEYEAGGVIQSQGDTNQEMLFQPTFVLNTSGGNTWAAFSIVQLYGNSTQLLSPGTTEVYSHVGSVQTYPSNGSASTPGAPFKVTVTIGTVYPCSWATYLNRTLANSGLAVSGYTLTPSACIAAHGVAKLVTMVLTGVNHFTLYLASFTLVLGVGQA
jgi:hypothetical protein